MLTPATGGILSGSHKPACLKIRRRAADLRFVDDHQAAHVGRRRLFKDAQDQQDAIRGQTEPATRQDPCGLHIQQFR